MISRAALVLLFVAAACGNSDSTDSVREIATSSTTAEEARAIDGPVMRYPDASSTSGKLATLLQGGLQLEGDCLYLVQKGTEERFPILWPAGTRWARDTGSDTPPAGDPGPRPPPPSET